LLFASGATFAQHADTSLDRAVQFVGWVDSDRLQWQPLHIPGHPAAAEYRLLSLDANSGARSQITMLPPGWQRPPGYYDTNEEFLVLEGEVQIGQHELRRYSYGYHPAGYAQGRLSTTHGATILQWWDAQPAFVETEISTAEARLDEVVEGWHFDEQPWTSNADFPQWADFDPSPEMRLKLLRLGPDGGHMTWLNFNAGSGRGLAQGRPWEVHPMWEEAMLLEGDLTYTECLPGGEVTGTYRPRGYFFRPGGIAHGGPNAYSSSYTLFIFRSAEQLWTEFYTSCEDASAAAAQGAPDER
jgi:hypothetical protein